ncbi:MAG: glycosyltransferase family 2 protein [Caldilinea sp. CFX5]|nr:glycosyltransferase family 2 protein [Caldilinea sp. CFX5]
MNDSPIFSVIIPTYNRAFLLARAIHSVLEQTFQGFELIIVDDFSTDNTFSIVESFIDPRIIYLRHTHNKGAAATRNSGIKYARGEYVAFLDDDDEYFPQFLMEMNLALSATSPNVGFAWCSTLTVRDSADGEQKVWEGAWQPTYQNRDQAYRSFLHSRRIGTNCGLTIRSTCFDVVGLFDETMSKAEDTDFLIRIVRHFDFTVIPVTLVKVHQHTGTRLTFYDRRMAEAYELIIQKHLATLTTNPQLGSTLYYKTGWLYYHGGDTAKARQYMLMALRCRPFYLKTWATMLTHELFRKQATQLHKQLSRLKSHILRI